MRANEFIKESNQLNEFLPLVAAIPSLISWAFTAWSAYSIYQVAKEKVDKTGGDPSKLTEQDWWDIGVGVAVSVVINKIPGVAGAIKRRLAKVTPEEKAKAVAIIKPKVMDLFKSHTAGAVGATAVAVGQGPTK
jgi:hypothetical protein